VGNPLEMEKSDIGIVVLKEFYFLRREKLD
jgi:hypothetical protein